MKVFYSWQSDTPSKIGNNFIREALKGAIEIVVGDLNLDEAQREALHIDHDTKGVLGSPPIADTILDKITKSDIFVADVTLTGSTLDEKPLINSNVAYELGYAHASLSDIALLKVMNIHYGSPDTLPFDLQHRRWPVQFNLSPEAGKEQRRTEQQKLSKELSKILIGYVDNLPNKPTYQPIASTYNPAVYWEKDKTLIEDRILKQSLSYPEKTPLIYLHIWPEKKLEDLTGTNLSGHEMRSMDSFLFNGYTSRFRNKHGLAFYRTLGNNNFLGASTQIFKNREIWGVNSYFLSKNYIPTGAVEESLRDSLNKYLEHAKNELQYGRVINIEFGMVKIEGFQLAVPPEFYMSEKIGEIFEDFAIVLSVDSDDEESIKNALLTIFEKIFDIAGQARPTNLYDFPEKRPRSY